MGHLLYFVGWLVVKFLQSLPLNWVARLGRAGGAVACALDARHRRVALRNMALCFPERTPTDIRALVRENFRRIGENYCAAIKTAAMPWDELKERVTFSGPGWVTDPPTGRPPPSLVFAIGHFGNFEIYARIASHNPAYQSGTTYRGLQPAALNRLLQSLRQKSGCHYFERRTELAALKAWMAPTGRLIGFLSDQHAGRSGVRSQFFGRECATTTAPVIFALRYKLPLAVAICYRVDLARWHIEFSPEIPTTANGEARSIEDIVTDINRAFEAGVRKDPANWFWVHNRWKPDKLPPPRTRRPSLASPPPDVPSVTTSTPDS